MNSLLMIVPALIFAIQSAAFKFYSKKCDQNSGANALFSTSMLAITALFAFCFAIGTTFDSYSIMYGAILGVCFFGFVRLYNEAMACGPMSYTVFIFSMSMIIPIIASMFVYGEYPTVLNYIGFAILLIAIILMNFSSKRTVTMVFTKKWVILCIFGTIFNGFVGFTSKVYPMEVAETNFALFMFVAFLVATILSCVAYSSKNVRNSLAEFKPTKWFFILAVGIAITNFAGNALYSMFSSGFDASIYFPTVNGSSMMISMVFSYLFFKERLKPAAVLGVLLGVLSVILMSI